MTSNAKLFGHPIHPIFVAFPVGLLGTSVVFDLIYLATRDSRWTVVAMYMIGAGLICGLWSAAFGLADWLGIPAGTRAKKVGAWHGIGNVVMLALFLVSFYMRYSAPAETTRGAIVVSIIGVLVLTVTGWLGGEMVFRHGVGVEDGANLNSPGSLSREEPRPRRVA